MRDSFAKKNKQNFLQENASEFLNIKVWKTRSENWSSFLANQCPMTSTLLHGRVLAFDLSKVNDGNRNVYRRIKH